MSFWQLKDNLLRSTVLSSVPAASISRYVGREVGSSGKCWGWAVNTKVFGGVANNLCVSYQFQDLLSQQTDKQSIIFLKDVTFVDLRAIVDYMYRGEVNVSQGQLSSFLHTTEALKIRGNFIAMHPSCDMCSIIFFVRSC